MRTEAVSIQQRWRIIAFSILAWTFSNFDQSLFGYAIPDLLTEFRIGLADIGLVLAISFAVASILVSLGGWAADRFGRRTMLIALLASSAFCVGMQAMADSLLELTVWRSLAFGLSGGLASVTAAYVAEAALPQHRGMVMGFLQIGYPLGWFIASLVAVPLLASQGWRALFWVGFAVVPIAFLIGSRLPESGRFLQVQQHVAATGVDNRGRVGDLFAPEFRWRSIIVCLIFFAFGSAYAGTAFFFPTYFTQVRGYTPSEAAWLVGLSNGVAVIGYVAAAYVGEFITTRRNTTAIWCAIGAVALVIFLWVPETPWQDKLLFAITTSFFYGVNGVLVTLLAELFPTRVRTTAFAVCGSAPLSIGFAVYPMVVPLAVGELGWQMALTVAIAPLLLLVSALSLLLPNLRSGADVAD